MSGYLFFPASPCPITFPDPGFTEEFPCPLISSFPRKYQHPNPIPIPYSLSGPLLVFLDTLATGERCEYWNSLPRLMPRMSSEIQQELSDHHSKKLLPKKSPTKPGKSLEGREAPMSTIKGDIHPAAVKSPNRLPTMSLRSSCHPVHLLLPSPRPRLSCPKQSLAAGCQLCGLRNRSLSITLTITFLRIEGMSLVFQNA